MSITINSNHSAQIAANNLDATHRNLQRSLNRLSSGQSIAQPSDDAGGLAVSMKMAAAINRHAAANSNVGNAVSFLQTQDGALQTAHKILDRMSELKTLSQDVTKNASDRSNYETEFQQLKTQLGSVATEQFNGIDLFGTVDRSVSTTPDQSAGSDVTLQAVDLLGANAAPFTAINDNFDTLDNFTNTSSGTGNASLSAGELLLETNNNDPGRVDSDTSVSGAWELNLTFQKTGVENDDFSISLGGSEVFSYDTEFDTGTHSLRIVFDGVDTAEIYLDGSATPTQTNTGIGSNSGAIRLELNSTVPGAEARIDNFSIASDVTSNDVGAAAAAGSLDSLGLSTLTGAIEEIATFRARNGAQQSRLTFASEQLRINQTNLEAANSRIIDVDVAEESTLLARHNVLMQAGASMLQQANQTPQVALRLLG